MNRTTRAFGRAFRKFSGLRHNPAIAGLPATDIAAGVLPQVGALPRN
ncbi:hypothetical protein ACFVUS_06100 [Nocardia sp. NPDC058058]